MNYTVYIHINKTNGKVYIGITGRSVEARWGNGQKYRSNKHFYSAIQKYGWDGFLHIVFRSQLSKEEAARMEQQLITSYKADNPSYGYNKSKGGEYGNYKGKNSGTPEYGRTRYRTNMEEIKAQQREYHQSHKEKHKAKMKAYYIAHRDEHKARCKSYRETHKEEKKAYRETHKEEIKAYNKSYIETHKEEKKAYNKAYYERKKLTKLNLITII